MTKHTEEQPSPGFQSRRRMTRYRTLTYGGRGAYGQAEQITGQRVSVSILVD
ncbi:hypothetical protein [Labrenzia sp. DG1229]|uniref:hypothetical protein n=1 Tax=Labrenzia sp. DG1229 TaxID=681847 RepID=UPI000AF6D98B|nr:hypothetical protein [Labrenzia sp. DG1229]